MPEGGTGFEAVEKPERPLGLDKTQSTTPEDSSYVLEMCGAGECVKFFSMAGLINGIDIRGFGLDSRIRPT